MPGLLTIKNINIMMPALRPLAGIARLTMPLAPTVSTAQRLSSSVSAHTAPRDTDRQSR